MEKGLLIVISGPAGSGKGTVCSHLLKSDSFAFSVSATTRAPRPGEQDGVNYHFISRDDFLSRIEQGAMLEYTEYCGNFYGTPKKEAEDVLEELSMLEPEELMKSSTIAKILGYESFENFEELAIYPRGYRILNKVPRMPNSIVEKLVKSFKSFQHILDADLQQLDDVEGIGEIRARTIKTSLKRMQEQFVFDNLII